MINDQNNYLVQCPTIWSDQYTTFGSKAAKDHNKSVGINCTKNGLCNINLKCKKFENIPESGKKLDECSVTGTHN